MHDRTGTFLRTAAEAFELAGPVYEFGYCPTGDLADAGILRECFPQGGYIGCEVGGPAEIDRLSDLSRLPFPDAAARTVVCIDTLEHVEGPPQTVEEMARILMPGGVLVLSAAVEPGDSPGPDNCWRLTPQVVQRVLSPFEATLVAWQGPAGSPHTVYAIACKAPVGREFVAGAGRLLDLLPRRMEALAIKGGWLARLFRRFLLRPDRRGDRHSPEMLRVESALHVPLARDLAPHFLLGPPAKAQTGTRLDLSQ